MGIAISWIRYWLGPSLTAEELAEQQHEQYTHEFRNRIERIESFIHDSRNVIRTNERKKANLEQQLVQLLHRTRGMPQNKADKQQALSLLKTVNRKEARLARTYNYIHKLEQVKETYEERLEFLRMHTFVSHAAPSDEWLDMGKMQDTWADIIDNVNEMAQDHETHELVDPGLSEETEEDLEKQLQQYCLTTGLHKALQSGDEQTHDELQIVVEDHTTEPPTRQEGERMQQRVVQIRQMLLS